MTRRITLTLRDDEAELIAQLRDVLDPERPLATFAADCLIASVEAELCGTECNGQHWQFMLSEWRPDGRPN